MPRTRNQGPNVTVRVTPISARVVAPRDGVLATLGHMSRSQRTVNPEHRNASVQFTGPRITFGSTLVPRYTVATVITGSMSFPRRISRETLLNLDMSRFGNEVGRFVNDAPRQGAIHEERRRRVVAATRLYDFCASRHLITSNDVSRQTHLSSPRDCHEPVWGISWEPVRFPC